jgi:hypothetical protein
MLSRDSFWLRSAYVRPTVITLSLVCSFFCSFVSLLACSFVKHKIALSARTNAAAESFSSEMNEPQISSMWLRLLHPNFLVAALLQPGFKKY